MHIGINPMHAMLADDVSAGLVALFYVCGGVATAVLALIALVPASQANRLWTYILAAPALIWVILVTVCLFYQSSSDKLDDAGESLRQFIGLLVVMAGPSLVTSLLAILALWYKRRKIKA
jgi:uncharacterized membrane-anchored protein